MAADDPAPGGGTVIQGKVKWFNAEKGFGFVVPADGSPDVFLHISVLKQANLRDAPEGATISCEVEQAPKGRQVVRIVEMDTSTAVRRNKPPRR